MRMPAESKPGTRPCLQQTSNSDFLAVLLYAMIVSSPETLFGQTPTVNPTAAPPAPPAEPDGVTRGGYQDSPVHRTGLPEYRRDRQRRHVRYTGKSCTLARGILDQNSYDAVGRSPGHLFDDLPTSTALGWGGDPNNAMHALRADKNKWYNFQSSFRRDQRVSSTTTCWQIR